MLTAWFSPGYKDARTEKSTRGRLKTSFNPSYPLVCCLRFHPPLSVVSEQGARSRGAADYAVLEARPEEGTNINKNVFSSSFCELRWSIFVSFPVQSNFISPTGEGPGFGVLFDLSLITIGQNSFYRQSGTNFLPEFYVFLKWQKQTLLR